MLLTSTYHMCKVNMLHYPYVSLTYIKGIYQYIYNDVSCNLKKFVGLPADFCVNFPERPAWFLVFLGALMFLTCSMALLIFEVVFIWPTCCRTKAQEKAICSCKGTLGRWDGCCFFFFCHLFCFNFIFSRYRV